MASHFALCAQLFQAGQGYGGSRLAAQAFGAQLGLGHRDFGFRDVQAPAAGFLNHAGCLAPGGRIADADGGGPGVRLHGLQFCASAIAAKLRTSGLAPSA